MKNNSPIYPFDIPGDKYFDTNKDGKLSGLETVARDAHQAECGSQADQERFQKYYGTSSSASGSIFALVIGLVIVIAILYVVALFIGFMEDIHIDLFTGGLYAAGLLALEIFIHKKLDNKLNSAPKMITYMIGMVLLGAAFIFVSFLFKYGMQYMYETVHHIQHPLELIGAVDSFEKDEITNTLYISLIVDGIVFILDGAVSAYKYLSVRRK